MKKIILTAIISVICTIIFTDMFNGVFCFISRPWKITPQIEKNSSEITNIKKHQFNTDSVQYNQNIEILCILDQIKEDRASDRASIYYLAGKIEGVDNGMQKLGKEMKQFTDNITLAFHDKKKDSTLPAFLIDSINYEIWKYTIAD